MNFWTFSVENLKMEPTDFLKIFFLLEHCNKFHTHFPKVVVDPSLIFLVTRRVDREFCPALISLGIKDMLKCFIELGAKANQSKYRREVR